MDCTVEQISGLDLSSEQVECVRTGVFKICFPLTPNFKHCWRVGRVCFKCRYKYGILNELLEMGSHIFHPSWTCCVAEDDLKLLFLLPLPPRSCVYMQCWGSNPELQEHWSSTLDWQSLYFTLESLLLQGCFLQVFSWTWSPRLPDTT